MKFRKKFNWSERNAGAAEVDAYVRGQSTDSPIFLENVTLEELKELEKAAREKTLAYPDNAFLRQEWIYIASLLRDTQIMSFSRTRVKANGLAGLYMEAYGASKIAVDTLRK